MIDLLPAGVWAAIFVVFSVCLTQLALKIFNLWYKRARLPFKNDTSGIIFGAISLLYSLLVAFVILAVWEDYEDLNRTVDNEINQLSSLVVHGQGMSDPLRRTIDQTVMHYGDYVASKEWNPHEYTEIYGTSAIPALREMLLKHNPANIAEERMFAILDENLSEVSMLRRERLGHLRSHVPQLIWLILSSGSALMMVFAFFLHVESEKLKRIYLSLLSALVAMSLFIVLMLDHPFNGSTKVSSKPYTELARYIRKIEKDNN
jgi:hypothetical protein